MRHGKKFNHLGRQAAHRDAMLANLAISLIEHKRITTTMAKAKALRKYVEPIITKSKDDTTHSRRTVFSYLQNKDSVTTLFREISEKVADRPGGYTRIIKLGNRMGDNAEMCMIELVDFNELMLAEKANTAAKATTRRSRKKVTTDAAPKAAAPVAETKVEESSISDAEVITDAPEADTTNNDTDTTEEEGKDA